MKLRNKLAASAAVIALAATASAYASVIGSVTIGGPTAPTQLASELNITTGSASSATLVSLLEPTTGSLPVGNVLLTVTLANGTFTNALSGSNVVGIGSGCTTATASTSSGGTAGGSTVTFLVSNAQNCDVTASLGDEGLQFTGAITPASSGTVTLTMNLLTEAGNQVDGPASTTTLITRAAGFSAGISADTTATQAALAGFTAFETASNNILGTVQAVLSTTAKSDYVPTAVNESDITGVTVLVTGNMDAFSGGSGRVFVDFNGDGTAGSDETLTVTTGSASRTFTGDAKTTLTSAARSVRVQPNGSTAIQASTYTATVTIDPNTAATPIAFGAADTVATGNLQSITRAGTSVVMPWFASGTQATVTGSNNLVRLSNVGSTNIPAVFATILSSSATITNPGTVNLAISIPAGGTTLISSQQLQDKMGVNWGTGDIQFTAEGTSAALTARRLIITGVNITEMQSGTVAQDQQ